MMAMRAVAAEAMPVAAGDADIGVNVTVHWAFAE
jgi:uncharacterized protein YggE